MKKNILLLTRVPLDRDPRVLRQIEFLKENHNFYLIGYDTTHQGITDCIDMTAFENPSFHLNYPALLRKICSFWIVFLQKINIIPFFQKIFWQGNKHEYKHWIEQKHRKTQKTALKKWANIDFNLIIANDVDTVPMALNLKNSFQVEMIFDAHEYYAHENPLHKSYQTHLCNTYIPQVKNCMTVCDGLAEEYVKNYHIPKPFVITNAPVYNELQPTETAGKIKLIHHGIYSPERIFPLVEMMQYADERFVLYFMIKWARNQQNYEELAKEITKTPNIQILPPVDTHLIPATINAFDIGMYLFQDSEENYNAKYSLPNKFFEFIQGRLMVATGPSIELAKIVKKHDLGLVTPNFDPKAMAEALNKLTPEQIMYHKQKSHEAAYELSGEKNKILLLQKVNELTK